VQDKSGSDLCLTAQQGITKEWGMKKIFSLQVQKIMEISIPAKINEWNKNIAQTTTSSS